MGKSTYGAEIPMGSVEDLQMGTLVLNFYLALIGCKWNLIKVSKVLTVEISILLLSLLQVTYIPLVIIQRDSLL